MACHASLAPCSFRLPRMRTAQSSPSSFRACTPTAPWRSFVCRQQPSRGGRATLSGPRVGAGGDWGARPSSIPQRARARTHTLHTHDDAAQAPADSLLERFRSNTDLKHMMQFEATLTVESSKAKRLELTRCQPLQPLLGPLHQCTSRTRTRRVCCQCRHEDEGPEASVESLSSCGQPFQSGIQAPALSLPSALRGARAVRHRPLSNPNGTALMPPRSATSPNPGCADSPRRVPGLTT